jgi:hypothetical protein
MNRLVAILTQDIPERGWRWLAFGAVVVIALFAVRCSDGNESVI